MTQDPNSSSIKRWEHFYLEEDYLKYKIAQVKWSSIISPACLPVTIQSFPSKNELQSNYLEYNYNTSNGGNIEGVSLAKKTSNENDAL